MSGPFKCDLTQQEVDLITEFRQLTELGRRNLVQFLKEGNERTKKMRREIEDEGPNPYDE